MRRLRSSKPEIWKMLKQGLSREAILDALFKKYENTIHHTDYFKQHLKREVSHFYNEFKNKSPRKAVTHLRVKKNAENIASRVS